YVVNSKLKVMLDSDYIAMTNDKRQETEDQSTMELGKSIIRELIIPEIEKEVNEGKNFAPLRQIYHSLILAKWYKETIKNSILSEIYVDQNKTAGVELDDKAFKEEIYEQYMQAYKKGVFDFIKEDYDELSQEVIPRKYFSGGFRDNAVENETTYNKDVVRMSVVGETFDVELGITAQKDGQAVNLPSFENEEYPTREMFVPGEILQFDDVEGGILLVADNGGDKSALSIKLLEQMRGLKVLSAGSSNVRWVDNDGGKTLIGSRRSDSPVINSRALGPKTVTLTKNSSANVRWILSLDDTNDKFLEQARTQGIQVVDLSDLDVYSQLDEIVNRFKGAVNPVDTSMLSEAFREKFDAIKASGTYSGSVEVNNHQEVLTIKDNTTDSSFSVVPGFGFKIHSLIVNGYTIYRPASDVIGSGGQVIMSPWVGRLENGQFEYNGTRQDINELESVKIEAATGYPKDGLVRNQQWILEDTGIDEEGAFIRASIDAADHPDILEHFGRSKLTMTIHIDGEDVFYDVEVENLDDKKVYNAVGLHEYGISTNRFTTLELKARSVLDADEKGIPTGERIALDSEDQEHLNFNEGNIVAAGAVDRTYTDVETDEQGRWQAIITDAERRIRRTYLVDGEMFQHPHIWSGNTDSYANITSVEFLTDAPNGINNPNSKAWLNVGEKRKGRIHMHVETDVKDAAILGDEKEAQPGEYQDTSDVNKAVSTNEIKITTDFNRLVVHGLPAS
ncbi:MAG: hypothetical protein KKD07_10810, partial [Candidatus Omnitrophica bacterium]|nr:hypothetical protein [Candidatus Omnitrophota bacterium]